MLKVSKEANLNYLAKVVKLSNLKKHPNADRLQTVSINFNNVITGMDAKKGQVYVYFPVECKINSKFLAATNSFRNKDKNSDIEKTGFFEDNCRVKAVKLRGERSMGYIVPFLTVLQWSNPSISYDKWDADLDELIDVEFDTINGVKLLEKYVKKTSNEKAIRQGKSSDLNRLVKGQANFHVNTPNLRNTLADIKPNDIISVTYKTHGTSWWAGNVLVKKQLKWYEKLAQKLGIKVVDTEYDTVYGSRRVVRNKYFEDPKKDNFFYSYNLWEDISNRVKSVIPKGYTLYGECLGYTKDGEYIQKDYDYSCEENEFKLEVYRITHTTPDGLVTELTYPQIVEFCERAGLTPSTLFFYGKAEDMYPRIKSTKYWHNNLLRRLQKEFNEKDCFMCVNSVPEEGIVIRKESLFSCMPYKLKSFRFLEKESKMNDAGVENIEDNN